MINLSYLSPNPFFKEGDSAFAMACSSFFKRKFQRTATLYSPPFLEKGTAYCNTLFFPFWKREQRTATLYSSLFQREVRRDLIKFRWQSLTIPHHTLEYYRCFLPDLAGFAFAYCEGARDHRRHIIQMVIVYD